MVYDTAAGIGAIGLYNEMMYYNPMWFQKTILNEKSFEAYRQRKQEEIIEDSDQLPVYDSGEEFYPIEDTDLDSLIKEIKK